MTVCIYIANIGDVVEIAIKKNKKIKSLVGINLVGTSFIVNRAFYLPVN